MLDTSKFGEFRWTKTRTAASVLGALSNSVRTLSACLVIRRQHVKRVKNLLHGVAGLECELLCMAFSGSLVRFGPGCRTFNVMAC